MPQKINVNVQLVDEQTINLQVGPFGQTFDAAWFFDRSVIDDVALRNNVRLAFQIGNYAHPGSNEFLTEVNGAGTRAGVQLGDGNYFINRVDEADGKYILGFGPRDGEETYTVEMTKEELSEPPQMLDVVSRNIKAFIRISRFTSWTPAAIDAVNAQKFWV